MLKVLFITIFLILQSFSSFGNPKGKGIICVEGDYLENLDKLSDKEDLLYKEEKNPKIIGFSFLDDKVIFTYLDKKNDDVVMLKSPPLLFKTTTKIIEWGGGVDLRWELDRKTLKLKEISKTKITYEYQCKVFSKDDYSDRMEEYRDLVQQFFDEELKKLDNKI